MPLYISCFAINDIWILPHYQLMCVTALQAGCRVQFACNFFKKFPTTKSKFRHYSVNMTRREVFCKQFAWDKLRYVRLSFDRNDVTWHKYLSRENLDYFLSGTKPRGQDIYSEEFVTICWLLNKHISPEFPMIYWLILGGVAVVAVVKDCPYYVLP